MRMNEDQLREEAIKRIKDRREFYEHLVVYLIVNAGLILLWWATGAGYFWPGWVLFGWGIWLAMHAWNALVPPKPLTEDSIRKEMHRLEPH
jgi:hypothetical protein